jgi:hypothetical protein
MNDATSRLFRLGGSLAGLVVLGWVLTGQAAKPVHHGIPLPTDWSHQHMIFSQPRSPERLAQISKDPRYWQQLYRRNTSQKLAVEIPPGFVDGGHLHHGPRDNFQRDWQFTLGTLSGSTWGIYPAKYSYDSSTANCGNAATPDYVVFSDNMQGTTSQASIVALDNLYSGCTTGTVPSTYWAYNTSVSTTAAVSASPIMSLDGTQVAFTQNDNQGDGWVVLLKWAANDGSVGSPTTPPLDTPAQYANCTTPPCMVQLSVTTSSGATTTSSVSSIYYDFANDIAWVGDDSGGLHQFQPFFQGTPTEIRNTIWPVTVSSTYLTSPVYDSVSNNVFVGDRDGFLYSVNATTGAVTASGQLDFSRTGDWQGPVVDSSNGFVYAFASDDNSTSCGLGSPCAAVYQLSTSFVSGDTGTKVTIGESKNGPAVNPVFIGGFDSAYYNSGTATGSLYVCGAPAANATLYRVPLTNGAVSASIPVATITGTGGLCSPVTDVPNPNTPGGPSERVFLSTVERGKYRGCLSAECVMSFLNTPWLPTNVYSVGQQVFSGSSDVETVIVAGTSSNAQPTWTNSTAALTTDGTIVWLDQGSMDTAVSAWAHSTSYTLNERVVDSNNNIEIATVPGTSGGSAPTWNQTAGGLTTTDGTITWTNAGTNGTFALSVTDYSGIISDNVVPPATLPGASQIYFIGICSESSSGCAVQASQTALQ